MLEKIKTRFYNLSVSNKLFIISIIIIILFLVLKIYNSKDAEPKFIDYINKMGYVNTDGGTLYYKNILGVSLEEFTNSVYIDSENHYEVNYFDVDNVLFKKNKRDYEDSTNYLLNETYDYKTRTVKYSYRVQYSDAATFIFNGKYLFSDGEFKFTCNSDYIYQFDIEDNDDVICNKLKSYVSDFYKEAMNDIDNYSLIDSLLK